MTRHLLVIALALSLPSLASAQQVPAIDTGQAPALAVAPTINPVSPSRVRLTKKERAGVKLARQWIGRSDMPAPGEDGSVTYLFGATLPSVVCTPLFVCDITLQPGEVISDINAGDAVRWKIAPATSGSGSRKTTHVMVKPTDAGLKTNLVITTDRRTYTIKLASARHDWMPRVSFSYPEDIKAQWAAYSAAQQRDREATVLPTGEDLASLDFGFRLSGDAPGWRPVRVYTDGVKTYVQFPRTVSNGDAPALVAIGYGDTEQLVNYRMRGDRYVVDRVLERATLISGVGGDQMKVDITRDGDR